MAGLLEKQGGTQSPAMQIAGVNKLLSQEITYETMTIVSLVKKSNTLTCAKH